MVVLSSSVTMKDGHTFNTCEKITFIASVKPLIHGQINLIKFIESNKFDNAYSKI